MAVSIFNKIWALNICDGAYIYQVQQQTLLKMESIIDVTVSRKLAANE